ncbi:PTD012 family protein [Acinetobacter baumannii]|nr:PTD012 family protein [Acinetobacter baumannii]ELB1534501.1 hypothetical protein [Acinetobacter baumannii]MCT6584773.1 hypothetical protein [Acinetobacter baumannii]MCT6584853.1 hypothetical protein [Acinetobacter baumannii]MCT6595672.1 hypothetical protein [Acinetobacter baumannii]MCT6655387.1 hypothetical protein [Acinetobacter baumannii]
MNDFFEMVVTLAKHFKDRPEVLFGLIVVLGGITLIWAGKLKGAISFGG